MFVPGALTPVRTGMNLPGHASPGRKLLVVISQELADNDPMQIEPLMKIRIQIGTPIAIGDMGRGSRSIGVVAGGTFEGDQLCGRIVPPGADWVVVGSDGIGEIDVRLALTTDDDANIYVRYTGVLRLDEVLLSGGETQFGDSYFVTQVRFETGAEKYAWLNQVVAIAEGRVIEGGVEYQVFHCKPGEK